MSGVPLDFHNTPVIGPASCGICSGAEPSGFNGNGDMVRSLVSTRESGCGAAAAWAAAVDGLMAVKDNAASAVAESCMVSRRDMFMAGLLTQIPDLSGVSFRVFLIPTPERVDLPTDDVRCA